MALSSKSKYFLGLLILISVTAGSIFYFTKRQTEKKIPVTPSNYLQQITHAADSALGYSFATAEQNAAAVLHMAESENQP